MTTARGWPFLASTTSASRSCWGGGRAIEIFCRYVYNRIVEKASRCTNPR